MESQHQMVSQNKASLTYVEKATSDNTRTAYRSDIRHFQQWGGRLPCDPEIVVRYLEDHASLLNSRTLRRRLVAIRQFHRYLGFDDPGSHPLVEKTMRGILNTFGQPRKQAAALLFDELEKVLSYIASQGTLTAARDQALISLGFAAGLRGSELVNLRWQDCLASAKGIVVNLPRSKTDPSGEGLSSAVPQLGGVVCACFALANWKKRQSESKRELANDYIFTRINRWQQIGDKPLSVHGLNQRIRFWVKAVGLANPDSYSSHSLRRGMATSASASGASFQSIMRQGRWRHEGTVLQYIEAGQQFEDNAFAKLAKK